MDIHTAFSSDSGCGWTSTQTSAAVGLQTQTGPLVAARTWISPWPQMAAQATNIDTVSWWQHSPWTSALVKITDIHIAFGGNVGHSHRHRPWTQTWFYLAEAYNQTSLWPEIAAQARLHTSATDTNVVCGVARLWPDW